jgi:hypothetical protein
MAAHALGGLGTTHNVYITGYAADFLSEFRLIRRQNAENIQIDVANLDGCGLLATRAAMTTRLKKRLKTLGQLHLSS